MPTNSWSNEYVSENVITDVRAGESVDMDVGKSAGISTSESADARVGILVCDGVQWCVMVSDDVSVCVCL